MYQTMPPFTKADFNAIKDAVIPVPIEYDKEGNIMNVRGFKDGVTIELKPGCCKGYWYIACICFDGIYRTTKDIATSRLHLYVPMRRFEFNPVCGDVLAEKTGNVYFIVAKSVGLVKIGTTENRPEARIAQIATMSPVPLTLIGSLPGGSDFERKLHATYAEHRKHGEWFKITGTLKSFLSHEFSYGVANS